MIWTALLALVAAVFCLWLGYAVIKQNGAWERALGRHDWEDRICSWVMAGFCGLIGGGLLIFAVMAAFQAGYNA